MNKFDRIRRFEFWSFWIVYFPAYFYWAGLAIKSRYTTYFTAANPLMNNSGALNVSKYDYLRKLPDAWIPKTCLFSSSISKSALKELRCEHQINFPLIVKPDRAERGKGVGVFNSIDAIMAHIECFFYQDWLMQEYNDLPCEAGILYHRFPNQKSGKISSITLKNYCTITGDGSSTLGTLILKNKRIKHRLKEFKIKYKSRWDEIPKLNHKEVIEPIGSHNLGTTFLSGQHLRSRSVEQLLDFWAAQLPGFYYGRFDIKFHSWETLLKGEQFAILEINGVNSEPTHIYQPHFKLKQAYQDIFFHMRIIYEISSMNRDLGIHPKRLYPFLKELIITAIR